MRKNISSADTKIVQSINKLREKMQALSDSELKTLAADMLERRQTISTMKNNSADKMIPEAFALVREACRRATGKEHYDVQLLSGLQLYYGKISEAKTGEGKTITIYLPAFMAALEGKGVHVVTVNDYLAERDATEAAKVFEMLGMTVGCVLNKSTAEERCEAYKAHITYVTNSELGFDYLRDHLVLFPGNRVLRGLHYCIIDEVDSILLDDARTPLIISGPTEPQTEILEQARDFAESLTKGVVREAGMMEKLAGGHDAESGDFILDSQNENVYLTDRGIAKMEETFHTKGSYDTAWAVEVQKAVNNAMKAQYIMQRDKDYVVVDGKITIINKETGRLSPGRRFTMGLHQALEAKERVGILPENDTIASITYQAFFNKYEKKAGLTGTAATSRKEFKDVYGMDVVVIPTNKPVIREDKTDMIFRTATEKWEAVAEEIQRTHEKGQPVLVGTGSIKDSELLSEMLQKRGISHNVLNAKNEKLEAEIVAQAGQVGQVTVSTNMAGRGTDIMLSEESRALGGLKVIGTERHRSRRIDNQLRGRSGRQGDPGSSQFYISLDDALMEPFRDKLDILMMAGTKYGEPMQNKALSAAVERAQKTEENNGRMARENLIKYDRVNNMFQTEFDDYRQEVLWSGNTDKKVGEAVHKAAQSILTAYIPDASAMEENGLQKFAREFFRIAPYPMNFTIESYEQLLEATHKAVDVMMEIRSKEFGTNGLKAIALVALQKALDTNWSRFLHTMDYLFKTIGTQSLAHRNPVDEYKQKGIEFFNEMLDAIDMDAARNLAGVTPAVVGSQAFPLLMEEYDRDFPNETETKKE